MHTLPMKTSDASEEAEGWQQAAEADNARSRLEVAALRSAAKGVADALAAGSGGPAGEKPAAGGGDEAVVRLVREKTTLAIQKRALSDHLAKLLNSGQPSSPPSSAPTPSAWLDHAAPPPGDPCLSSLRRGSDPLSKLLSEVRKLHEKNGLSPALHGGAESLAAENRRLREMLRGGGGEKRALRAAEKALRACEARCAELAAERDRLLDISNRGRAARAEGSGGIGCPLKEPGAAGAGDESPVWDFPAADAGDDSRRSRQTVVGHCGTAAAAAIGRSGSQWQEEEEQQRRMQRAAASGEHEHRRIDRAANSAGSDEAAVCVHTEEGEREVWGFPVEDGSRCSPEECATAEVRRQRQQQQQQQQEQGPRRDQQHRRRPPAAEDQRGAAGERPREEQDLLSHRHQAGFPAGGRAPSGGGAERCRAAAAAAAAAAAGGGGLEQEEQQRRLLQRAAGNAAQGHRRVDRAAASADSSETAGWPSPDPESAFIARLKNFKANQKSPGDTAAAAALARSNLPPKGSNSMEAVVCDRSTASTFCSNFCAGAGRRTAAEPPQGSSGGGFFTAMPLVALPLEVVGTTVPGTREASHGIRRSADRPKAHAERAAGDSTRQAAHNRPHRSAAGLQAAKGKHNDRPSTRQPAHHRAAGADCKTRGCADRLQAHSDLAAQGRSKHQAAGWQQQAHIYDNTAAAADTGTRQPAHNQAAAAGYETRECAKGKGKHQSAGRQQTRVCDNSAAAADTSTHHQSAHNYNPAAADWRTHDTSDRALASDEDAFSLRAGQPCVLGSGRPVVHRDPTVADSDCCELRGVPARTPGAACGHEAVRQNCEVCLASLLERMASLQGGLPAAAAAARKEAARPPKKRPPAPTSGDPAVRKVGRVAVRNYSIST
ncbi:hypothetical protein DIPPA_09429 [Diplonema papillatum]|nr:hypothetical protein DIPPA_09429 [Diplonema papillatum]